MKILALDASTTISGYALFENHKLKRYSSINKKQIKNSDIRLADMIKDLIKLIEYEQPNCVVIEDTAIVRNNPNVQKMLTMILGAVYGYCIINNFDYYSLRPTQWRSYVRRNDEKLPRKRDELKKWSIDKVEELFGIIDIDDNVSDAILIGWAFLNKEKKE